MSAVLPRPALHRRKAWGSALARHRGALVALAVFLVLFCGVNLLSGSFTYFQVSFIASGGAALALAAVGQTFVVLTGGFDLSAGAVVSLVNVVLGAGMGTSAGSQLLFGLVALGIGGAVGAVNGVLVAYLRMQPIVVTLATMFIVQGITLLVADKPGGAIAPEFVAALTGDAVPGWLPAPVVVVAAAALVWWLARNTRFGVSLYAVGSDEDAAFAAGVATRWAKLRAYVMAGLFYGAAGAFVSAQTGSADPLVGRAMLLEIFAAVALGGTALGGGRGGAMGSIIGAYTLMIAVNVLLVLNVPAFYSSVAEGALLILAVLGGSAGRRSPLAAHVRLALLALEARRTGTSAARHRSPPARPRLPDAPRRTSEAAPPGWVARNRKTLAYVLPAYAGLALVLLATQALFGNTLTNPGFFNALVVLSSFLAILALGQGTVILTGGLDLSLPWVITLVGIVVAGSVRGSDAAALWAVPLGLALGTAVGALNGLGIVLFGLPPIVMTLAMNGILQGAALVYSGGTPDGFASPGMRWIMTGHIGGLTPVVVVVGAFAAVATLLLGSTLFGRRVYAVGNSPLAARFSGVGVGATLMGAYALSGFCAALVGILLASFSGQASLGMGDEYLLPSIAAVVVGGSLITGGRGHYLGMLGGVLLLTALSTLLSGTMLPHAVRDIVFGLVVLGAVLALRD
ncbi:ABC transporter permease [Lichenibacterium ramalinae]|uniref:ABC transporter permease n=1 Tax=Lichenibacterium ramalinae TaxID=2316527 RepID=A0A4Q2REC0_9HYPH|nr:ABC transporter permease [Lichenibacterium ramalinae]RYB05316.1 ABC transporter permease [Lichenibacterium ramalinae]